MARARLDPAVLAHLEWLGFVRPTGLVVSAPALVRAGAILDRRDAEGQRLLRACLDGVAEGAAASAVHERAAGAFENGGASVTGDTAGRARGGSTARRTKLSGDEPEPRLSDFRAFAERVLGWTFSPKGYAGTPERPIPDELVVPLADHGETLRPDFAVAERDPEDGAPPWQLLVTVLESGSDLDERARQGGQLEVSPHGRMERLLRQTGVPAGLLCNGQVLRLLSAPRGESSGWLDFRVADMAQTAGRPICTALRLLLGPSRLLALPRELRLAALLADSRRFQNEVSERLAEQVLHALYELLRGVQAAHDASGGELLARVLAEQPDEVYHALLTVVLRLVFLLYAEERELLPQDETWQRFYSLAGLHERLAEDAALFPDTMDQRYGAWAQLLVLFRMVHDGARAPGLHLPPRHGVLFDPDRFPFLEGRTGGGARQVRERIEPPLIPDGTLWRAFEKLLVLDGERLSYRALDVEQIGSVYETMMGFRLETASGHSLAIKAQKKHGAPSTVDLDALLAVAPAARGKWLSERAARKLPPGVTAAVKDAGSLADLHAALLPVVDEAATPDLVPAGGLVLQPSEERRRSGSHYTPRALTEPIVRTTLEPVLARLARADGGQSENTALAGGAGPAAADARAPTPSRPPRPEQILDLAVCDPAMGSGAFLVEACRQLGDALVESWAVHGGAPPIPPDEDAVVHARRLVAQRCLYGVDRNPVAVDLAKVSLWLVTLARDHALTFVDHALRQGDSLVGLSRRQIEAFHWKGDAPRFQEGLETMRVREHVARVAALRGAIRQAGEDVSDRELRDLWDEARAELDRVRLYGDLVLAAWFDGGSAREREARRLEHAAAVVNGKAAQYADWLEERRVADPPLAPFHWELEFPEVFERARAGFDAIVGNPPFLGGRRVRGTIGAAYFDWLLTVHEGSSGNADLVAHFFRRAFALLAAGGGFGLIATNTIAQGDTRASGLRWIATHGGQIVAARRRVKWPGLAAVVVSVVHVVKGEWRGPRRLDGREVETITAFLFHRGGHDDPTRLAANSGQSFVGSYVLGMGFTFDDTDTKGVATPVAEMHRLLEQHPACAEVVRPYIGGEEVNTSSTHAHHRWVIDFRDRDENDCRERWPELMSIVEAKVKPERTRRGKSGAYALREPLPTRWWHHADKRPALYAAIAGLERVLVISQTSRTVAFAFVPTGMVYSHKLVVFPFEGDAALCTLQSRLHDLWARFFGSTMKDDAVYTPSDCFETFPFPAGWEADSALEAAGRAYHEHRAALMVQRGEGLTKTYNRFHDPAERDAAIARLRELHAAMDAAVLAAYGWTDLPTACEFLLEHEDDDADEPPPTGRRGRKKPWRYRWPDPVRDEILARLLELNAARAAEEARAGADARPRARGGKGRRKRADPGGKTLFD